MAALLICVAAGLTARVALPQFAAADLGLMGLGPVLWAVLLFSGRVDLSREWRERFERFRIRKDLCKSEISDAVRKELAQKDAGWLWAASVQPAHSPEGRRAAAEALKAKADASVLPPLYVPGFVDRDAASQIVSRSFGMRYQVADLLRWVFVICLIIAIPALFIGSVLQEKDTATETGPFLGLYYLFAVFGSLAFLVRRYLIVFRMHPARVLFLRKFNNRKLAKGFKHFSKKQVRPFGHLILLSDRNLKVGWAWWFMQRFYLLASQPIELVIIFVFDILLIPYVLICRNFNAIFFGPPNASRARDFRTLPKALRRRWWMNVQTQRYAIGLYLRCSDDWWKSVVEVFMLSSDVILLDVTSIAGGAEWEIDTITRLGLWSRVVVIREADKAASPITNAAVAKAIGEYNCGPHIYHVSGKLDDVDGFRSDVRTAIMRAVAQNRERWPDLIP